MKGQIYGSFLTMMRIGGSNGFNFGISTAAYQDLQRSTNYNWGSQEIFGKLDNLQWLGPGEDTITLNGVIFPEHSGSSRQIDTLRTLAGLGKAQILIGATGRLLGYWVITSITEGQSLFAAFGIPRKQEFTLTLRKYSEKTGQLKLLDTMKVAAGIV